jgi:rhamnose utilization protein RhaD (predicted bifunctional aldolase and dehydrogenase)
MAGSAIQTLIRYSARWGSDLELVQGAGGNTSVKDRDTLTVKASGKPLSRAENEDIFVSLPLSDARAMADGAPAPATPPGALRPSIETSLHAVIPQAVVTHLHMVDAIAYAVRQDAKSALTKALDGMSWAFVPYVKPGVGLAQAVRGAVAGREVDVVILGNHGILFASESCHAVDALIANVRLRLSVMARTGVADLDRLATIGERLGLEPARLPEAHLAALHPRSLSFATSGSLYPDHPVFLGRGARVQDPDAALDTTAETALHLVPGVGALLAPGLPDTAHEMAACLGLVASRIDPAAKVRPLTRAEEDELLNWDAEIYRRSLAKT